LVFVGLVFVALVLVGLVRLSATTIHHKKFMQNLFSEQANLSPAQAQSFNFRCAVALLV
jgi:hypothetical protein